MGFLVPFLSFLFVFKEGQPLRPWLAGVQRLTNDLPDRLGQHCIALFCCKQAQMKNKFSQQNHTCRRDVTRHHWSRRLEGIIAYAPQNPSLVVSGEDTESTSRIIHVACQLPLNKLVGKQYQDMNLCTKFARQEPCLFWRFSFSKVHGVFIPNRPDSVWPINLIKCVLTPSSLEKVSGVLKRA